MADAGESHPKRAIEGAILDGFTHVLGRDVDFSVEIGDRARDFEDPIVGPGAKVQFAHGHTNQFLGILAELAILFQLARRHAGVAIYFAIVAKPFLLAFPGLHDALANGSGSFLYAFTRDVAIFHGRHFDVKIDPIK